MRFAALLLLFIAFIKPAHSQKNVAAVVDKIIEVLGGKEKLNSISSIRKIGNIEFAGQKIPFNYYAVHQTAERTEFMFSGMTGYFVVTKDSGFNFNPFNGQTTPENMTAEDVKLARDKLDLHNILIDYPAKGYTIELLENEDVDGVDALQLKITIAPNKTLFYFIDPSSYYIIRIKTITISNGQQNSNSVDYYNFKRQKKGSFILLPMII